MRTRCILLLVPLFGLTNLLFGQAKPDSADGQPVLKVCSDDNPEPCASTPPRPTFTPDPKYPSEARKKHIEGKVLMEATIGTDGAAHDVQIVKSLGHGLDEESINALKKWKFRPAMREGKPVAVKIKVEMAFKMFR